MSAHPPSPVRLEQRDSIAVIRLDDGKVNALTPSVLANLAAALDEAERDSKAVALLGRPGRFSAGFDLKTMRAEPTEARALVRQGAELLLRLYTLPLPLVVGCTGHAVAGGALLVTTGDWRIGALGDFKIGLNEVSVGMPVPIFAHVLASDRLAPRQVVSAVLFSKLYDPVGALDAGWLDQTVDAEKLEETTLQKASELTRLPTPTYAASKRSLRARSLQHIRDTLAADLDAADMLNP